MNAIGRTDLADDPALSNNQGRAEQSEYLDQVIEEWTKLYPQKEVQQRLDEAGVPVGPIYSIADIVKDEQFQARDDR